MVLKCTRLSASGLVAGAGSVIGGILVTGGGAVGTVTVYNNTIAAGTMICYMAVNANTVAEWSPAFLVASGNGIFVSIGGGASVSVLHG